MENRVLKTSGAQGELLLTVVDSIPEEFRPVKDENKIVVGHSSTGHDHVIQNNGVTRFEAEPRDPSLCYLQIDASRKTPAELEHLSNAPNAHPTVLLEPGKNVQVRRAREEGPEGWRLAAD